MTHKDPPLLPILNLIARAVTGSCVLMTVSSGEMSCADDIEQWPSVIPIIVNSGALLFIDDTGQWRAVFCWWYKSVTHCCTPMIVSSGAMFSTDDRASGRLLCADGDRSTACGVGAPWPCGNFSDFSAMQVARIRCCRRCNAVLELTHTWCAVLYKSCHNETSKRLH
jgi:hypothetical protein